MVTDEHTEESLDGITVEAVGLGTGDYPVPSRFVCFESRLSISSFNAHRADGREVLSARSFGDVGINDRSELGELVGFECNQC